MATYRSLKEGLILVKLCLKEGPKRTFEVRVWELDSGSPILSPLMKCPPGIKVFFSNASSFDILPMEGVANNLQSKFNYVLVTKLP